MGTLQLIVTHTPVWVWAVLVFLIVRGVQAFRPAETTLRRLALVPLVFTAWGLWTLIGRYAVSLDASLLWLAGISAGAVIGWLLAARAGIHVDAASGRITRAADYSLLPLLVLTFLVKYAFEVALAMQPALAGDVVFRAASLMVSGGFTGIFIGKFLRYLRTYQHARQLPAGV